MSVPLGVAPTWSEILDVQRASGVRWAISTAQAPIRTAPRSRSRSDPCKPTDAVGGFRASDHALNGFEVTSATDAERQALLDARTRLRGLRQRLLPLTRDDHLLAQR